MSHYVCPMHSEITSDRATTCSKCGMKLELREEGREPASRKPTDKGRER